MSEIDASMLERARRGDPQAHAALYRAYAPMVYTLARRMLGSRSLAEDVLQDCFVEVIRKAGDYRGDAGIGAWIRQIAVNKCLSLLRSPWRQRRAGTSEQAMDEVAVATESADPNEIGSDLERALARLRPMARAVVWLHVVEGYTHEEIARSVGRTTSFSKSQLARACRQLRIDLAEGSEDNEAEACLGLLKSV